MVLARSVEFRGESYGLHSLGGKGGAAKAGGYVFRVRGSPGESTEFLITKPRAGRELPLARVKVYGPTKTELHLNSIENVAGTREGARALIPLFGRVEAEARRRGFKKITTAAYPYVTNFFLRRGFVPLESSAAMKKKMGDYRSGFTATLKEDRGQVLPHAKSDALFETLTEGAKEWSKKQPWGKLIAMKKTLARR